MSSTGEKESGFPAEALQCDDGQRPLEFIVCGTSQNGGSPLLQSLLREAGKRSGDRAETLQIGGDRFWTPVDDLEASPEDRPSAGHDRKAVTGVTWHFFSTGRRAFIAADATGPAPDTRGLASAASNAAVAVVLADAESGILPQTRQHAYIASLLGVGTLVLAVDGMDRVGFAQETFDRIAADFNAFAGRIAHEALYAVPLSLSDGDNLTRNTGRMAWYGGPALLELLETADAGRGAVTPAADAMPEAADQFAVHILWFGREPLYPGRNYHVTMGRRILTGQVTEIKHRVDVDTLDGLAARHIDRDTIAYCTLSLDRAVPFAPYGECRALGGFLMTDRSTKETVGGGTIDFALWRASTIPWQDTEITKAARMKLNRHKPVVLWFTGLSGAGKSAVANQVAVRLHARECRTYLLDGDNIRHGLTRDLGFKAEDRVENIRRVGEVSKLFVDAGLIVLVALISPFRNERMMARELVEPGEFIEIFVDTPLEECERRDIKGLYARARAGEIRNFTGIDSPYEPPEKPEIVLHTIGATPGDLADKVIAVLEQRGVI